MRINFLYKLLVTSYGFSMFSEGIILPIYAVFVQGIGGDILDASGAMAIFLITEGLVTIIVHRLGWVNRHRLKVMTVGWAIWTLGIGVYLLISSVLMLFLAQVLTAIGNALADPIFDQELANHTDKKSEEFEWGFWEGSNSLIQGIAVLIGGLLVAAFSFHALIFAMVGAATISLILIIVYTSYNKNIGESKLKPVMPMISRR